MKIKSEFMQNLRISILVMNLILYTSLAMSMEQAPPVRVAPMATLRGLPTDVKRLLLTYLVCGYFKVSLKSIRALGATCRSYRALVESPSSMLPVLNAVPYTACAIELSNCLPVKNYMKVIAWRDNAKKGLKKVEELAHAKCRLDTLVIAAKRIAHKGTDHFFDADMVEMLLKAGVSPDLAALYDAAAKPRHDQKKSSRK